MDLMETAQLLGNLGEFAAAFGVIASLIYVGTQVRQNTRTMKSASRLGLASMQSHNNYTGAIEGDLGRIVLEGIADLSSLTPIEKQRWTWWFEGYFHMIEGYYEEYLAGQFDDEVRGQLDGWIGGLMTLDSHQSWWEWERQQNRFTPRFCEYVDELIENPPDTAWKWQAASDVLGRIKADE